jgi:hypothetical protein
MVFGLFKNRPPTALDALIRLTYGDNPPLKSANLTDACQIAHKELLLEQINATDVQTCAQDLFAGPIPYSTHDLATSVALHFLKKPELLSKLESVQLHARKRVSSWSNEGKVVVPLARSFEAVVSKRYQSAAGDRR